MDRRYQLIEVFNIIMNSMKLFHVSEEPDITVFKPRKPYREDMRDSPSLVWAIDEKRLPNFLTPRDCPRVTFHKPDDLPVLPEDQIFFSSDSISHVVAIESEWFGRMEETTLYIYEFDPEKFSLQDSIAGYYVSEAEQKPLNIMVVDDLFQELFKRNVELRIMENLQYLSNRIKKISLNWSMCRMGNAKPQGNSVKEVS